MTRSTILVALALLPTASHAATLAVPTAYPTVGAAVVAAVDGDTIFMNPGDFSGEGLVDLGSLSVDILGSGPGVTTFPRFTAGPGTYSFVDGTLPCGGVAINVLGDIATATTIDNVEASGCNQPERLMFVVGDLDISNSSFSNMVVEMPGLITAWLGDHTLTNVQFSNVVNTGVPGCTKPNSAVCSGGAAAGFVGTNLTVTDSTFDQCSADDGGCLWIWPGTDAVPSYGRINIDNSSFTNSTGTLAGAIYAFDFRSFSLTSSTVSGVNTSAGPAVLLDDSIGDVGGSVTIASSTITNNANTGDGGSISAYGFANNAIAESGALEDNVFCGNSNSVGATDVLLSSFDDMQVKNNVFALGDGLQALESRGSLTDITNNTFAGHTGHAILTSSGVDPSAVTLSSSLFVDLDGTVVSDGGSSATGRYLGRWTTFAWSDNFLDAFFNPNAVEQDPEFQNYVDQATTTCTDLNLWLSTTSPMRDAGDPLVGNDPDNSLPDIGAYGGPSAPLLDFDTDGSFEDVDCDDNDSLTYPGAPEVPYDGIDQDCDGLDLLDADGDGEDAIIAGGLDCDDDDATINTSAVEIWYDDVDQNCDGANDFDQDGDGESSDQAGGVDCDDLDDTVNTAATEIWYDGVDQDCDGGDDFDQDGDGFATEAGGGIDCDDTNPNIAPGVTEIWYDGIDQDCDGADDDRDNDGFDLADDCDDLDATINPDANDLTEDGLDQNCDGVDGTGDGTGTGSGNGNGDGCGCSSSGNAPLGWAMLMLPMLALRRRRR